MRRAANCIALGRTLDGTGAVSNLYFRGTWLWARTTRSIPARSALISTAWSEAAAQSAATAGLGRHRFRTPSPPGRKIRANSGHETAIGVGRRRHRRAPASGRNADVGVEAGDLRAGNIGRVRDGDIDAMADRPSPSRPRNRCARRAEGAALPAATLPRPRERSTPMPKAPAIH